jgi:hypothetical protein
MLYLLEYLTEKCRCCGANSLFAEDANGDIIKRETYRPVPADANPSNTALKNVK